MTVQERATALEDFGFTPRQAQFVGLAALVSGYCLRRHYQAFAGVPAGVQVRTLLDGLVARRWASRQRFRADRGHVYHLSGKPLYTALGETDNRHRRRLTTAAIARKMMLLDAVLTLPDHQWYATEADKVQRFRQLDIPQNCLPRRRYAPPTGEGATMPAFRYFVEKFAIGHAVDEDRFVFLYLATDPTARSFERFLNDHAPLLTKVPRWAVRVVYPPPVRTHHAYQHVFDRWYADLPKRPAVEDVRWAMETHARVQRRESGVSIDELHRLQDVFAAVGHVPGLMAHSAGSGGHDLLAVLASTAPPFAGALEEFRVPDRYDLFGALPGLA